MLSYVSEGTLGWYCPLLITMTTRNVPFTVRYTSIERMGIFPLRADSSIDQLKKRLLRKLNLSASNKEHITVYLTMMVGREDNLQPCPLPLLNDPDMLYLLNRESSRRKQLEFTV